MFFTTVKPLTKAKNLFELPQVHPATWSFVRQTSRTALCETFVKKCFRRLIGEGAKR
jgi:hypothetical protein